MRKNFQRLIPILAIVLIVNSCGKKDTTGLMIPKDAAVVVHVNAAAISSKISIKEIQASEWFQKLLIERHSDAFERQVLSNPDTAGMDLKSDFAFFVKTRENGGYIVMEGKLADAGRFEAFNRNMRPTAAGSKDGSFTFLEMDDRVLAAWSGNHFAYIVDDPRIHMSEMDNKRSGFDIFDTKTNMDSVKAFAKKLFGLSGSDLLGSDERFANLVSDGGDIHFWMNSSVLYTNTAAEGVISMMTFSEMLKDNVSAMTVRFENGKIAINSKQYYGKEISAVLKKFSAKKIDAATINRLPASTMGVLAFNFSPQAVKELIKLTGMDGMLNSFLKKYNYTIDDFVEGNKGEVIFALTNIGAPETSGMFHKEEPTFVLANAVNNEASFKKLMDIVFGDRPLREFMPGFGSKLQNGWFVAGNSEDDANKFLTNANNNLPFANLVSGHPIGGYLDIQKILKVVAPVPGRDSESDIASYKATVKMWQDVVITGGDFDDNSTDLKIEINLVNKTDNSLRQLNHYAETMKQLVFDRRRQYMVPDSSTLLVPDSMAVPKAFDR